MPGALHARIVCASLRAADEPRNLCPEKHALCVTSAVWAGVAQCVAYRATTASAKGRTAIQNRREWRGLGVGVPVASVSYVRTSSTPRGMENFFEADYTLASIRAGPRTSLDGLGG
jgi:hypothetical protein